MCSVLPSPWAKFLDGRHPITDIPVTDIPQYATDTALPAFKHACQCPASYFASHVQRHNNHGFCTISLCFTTISDLSSYVPEAGDFRFPKEILLCLLRHILFFEGNSRFPKARLFWCLCRRTLFWSTKGRIYSSRGKNLVTPKRFRNCQIPYDLVHGAFRNAKLDECIGCHGRLTQAVLHIRDSGNVSLKKNSTLQLQKPKSL